MFTGIIKDVGTVKGLALGEDGSTLITIATELAKDAVEGASIAVNGVCLTVLSFDDTECGFQAIPETLDKTNLGELTEGSRVNLEPALKLNDGLDGHLVQGHVDCTGEVVGITQNDDGVRIQIRYPQSIDEFIVYKGSISVNGVSLTIGKVEDGMFEIALIQHTLENTHLGSLESGDTVNLEIDMMARYASKLIALKNRNA